MDSCACSVWIYELDYLHLKGFLHSECDLYGEQPLTPPQCKIIVVYSRLNHRLAIEIGWWSINPWDSKLCYFCSYNVVENKTWFMLEHSLLNFTRARNTSLFQNVSSTRQAQVFLGIGLTAMLLAFISWRAIVLLHSRELTFCVTILILYFKSHKPFGVLDFVMQPSWLLHFQGVWIVVDFKPWVRT